MNFKEIKKKAKEITNEKMWDIWKPTLIMMVVSTLIGAVGTKLFGANNVYGDMFSTLFTIFLLPLEVGMTSYVLKITRKEDYDLGELTKYYSKFALIFIIYILQMIMVLLGTIALIIPGIIIALSYSMTFYILIDNDNLSAKEYLRRSKEMMNGYKADYLLFCLSFIGWIFACVLIIPMIFVVPYITVAQTLYYEELKNKKNM